MAFTTTTAAVSFSCLIPQNTSAQAQRTPCGVNPITGQPGFTRDPKGQPGHLRPSRGGDGWWHARRSHNRSGVHNGLDISGNLNRSQVYANNTGTVIFAGNSHTKAGWMVKIRDDETGVITIYAHLKAGSVTDEKDVEEGEEIGVVGNTGNAQHAPPHVHFGVFINGKDRDPEKYLNSPCPPGR